MTLADIERECTAVDGVVFDFGGVMTVSSKDDEWPVYAYCAKFGVDRAAVDRGWQRYRNLWDGGFISFAELYGRTFADAGVTIGAAQLDDLWELDAADWFRTMRTDTLALMRRLKASGKKLGVLSNLSPESYERLFVPRCAEYRAARRGGDLGSRASLQARGADLPPHGTQDGPTARPTDLPRRHGGERARRPRLRLARGSLPAILPKGLKDEH